MTKAMVFHVGRRGLQVVLLLALLLIGARAALPLWLKDEINGRMAQMGPYRGYVTDVDVALYRGAYRIETLVIEKRSGKVPVPLLHAPLLDLSVSWRDLLNGAFVAEAEFTRPQLTLVDGGERAEGQSGRGVDWRARLEELFPIRLNHVWVRNGTIAFRNLLSSPPVDVRAESVNGAIHNLTNVRDPQGRRDARLDMDARILGGAPVHVELRFDPWSTLRDFDLRLRATGMDLTRLNDLARAYANLDLASGHGDFVMELEATGGQLSGYAKPLLKDMNIVDWEQDVERDKDNPLELLWESLSGAITQLFQNQPRDQFATRIPIEGSIGEAEADQLAAIAGILRNAFVNAYESDFDDVVE